MTEPFPPLDLQRVAQLLAGEAIGDNVPLTCVTTDSRKLPQGALFVALNGPNFDGHHFVAAAREGGAHAALVSQHVADPLPQIRVADTRLALGQLAAAWRLQYTRPLIALTGSNGKTTVKEMIAAILRTKGQTLATEGNLNNDLGVPLTLLRLQADDQYAVIEMGANHHGEIAYLTGLARPDVAIINNAGPCHLDGFGDVAGVARAKGEIFQGLSSNGIAIINRDDPYADDWIVLNAGRHIIDFGFHPSAAVRAEASDPTRNQFQLVTIDGAVDIQLPVPGAHNVRNALAAAAATLAVGATLADIRDGLHNWRGVGGRMQRLLGQHGGAVIHDAYNANPASLNAALQTIGAEPGRKWLVLGDMRELGPTAEALHAQCGREAQQCGFERLYALGADSQFAATAFGAGGVHYTDIAALNADLVHALSDAKPDTVTVLVKGSRGMRMERVIAALTNYSSEEQH